MFFRKLLFERYLDKGETLIYTVHRHWITIHRQMLRIGFFGYVIPTIILLAILSPASPASVIIYGWYIIALMYTTYAFLDWYLDAWLITDLSIIDTKWDGFFKQSSSRVDYESIESVDIEMRGIKQSLLNYGRISLIRSSNIHVQMEYVYKPKLASARITQIQGEIAGNKRTQNSEALKDLLAEVIEERIRIKSES